MSYSYDTFEDEKEISKLIKKLQSESINHMKRHDAWEVPSADNVIKPNQKKSILHA